MRQLFQHIQIVIYILKLIVKNEEVIVISRFVIGIDVHITNVLNYSHGNGSLKLPIETLMF